MGKRTIAVIATLDTRGDEVKFLKDEIVRRGCQATVIDAGVMGSPYAVAADIPRQAVAEAGGSTLEYLQDAAHKGADRAAATAVMSRGVARLVQELQARGQLDGVLGLGGGTGAVLGTAAMHVLPVGIPKLQLSTHPRLEFFGLKDIMVLQSPVDLVGMNTVIRRLLSQAALAITAMAEAGGPIQRSPKHTVGITCWGVVTPGAMNLVSILESSGYETVLVHGLTAPLEEMVSNGTIDSIVDLCAQELVDIHIVPTRMTAINRAPISHDRFASAVTKGLPMILTPGTLDGAFLPLDDPRFQGRKTTVHVPGAVLVRTSHEELQRLGAVLADRANAATGPVAVMIPMHGLSANDGEGLALYDPSGTEVLAAAVEARALSRVLVRRVASHINDTAFARAVAEVLEALLQSRTLT
jgi:uncharacterized protein (UPF0261 family)